MFEPKAPPARNGPNTGSLAPGERRVNKKNKKKKKRRVSFFNNCCENEVGP